MIAWLEKLILVILLGIIIHFHFISEIALGNSAKYKNSQPINDLVFIKTHKSASTTITNILLKRAYLHNLTIGLPPDPTLSYIGDYPNFDKNKIYWIIFFKIEIPEY